MFYARKKKEEALEKIRNARVEKVIAYIRISIVVTYLLYVTFKILT